MSDIQQRPPSFWEGLMTGGYAAGNELLFGLPDFLVSKIGGDAASERLRAMRERNATANLVGTGAGLVGGMFIPGGAIAKGAGAALRGAGQAVRGAGALSRGLRGAGTVLTNAGRFAAGTGGRLGSAIGRGAIQAAEQAIPRAIFTGATTGDWGQSAQDAALGIGIGGAAGGVFRGLGNLARRAGQRGGTEAGTTAGQHIISEAQEAANKGTLQHLGIETKALRDAARSMGLRSASSRTNRGGDYVDELATQLNQRGVRGKRDFENLIAKNQEQWARIDEAFGRNAPKDWNKQLATALGQDTDLAQLISEAGDPKAQQFLNTMLKDLGGKSNLANARNTLGNIIRNNMTSLNPSDKVKAQIAMALKGKLDDFVASTSGEDIGEAKELFKVLQPFVQQEGRDVFALNKLSGGSPTFEKGMMSTLLGTGGAGSSVASDISEGRDVDIQKALIQGVGGALGGLALNKFAPAIVNKTGAAIGRGVQGAINNPTVAKIGANLIDTAITRGGAAADTVADVVSKRAGDVPFLDNNPLTQPGAVPADQALEPGQAQEVGQDTQEVLESAGPEDFSPELRAKIEGRMADIYASEFAAIMGPEEFRERIMALTNGLTDKASLGFLLYDTPAEAEAYGQRLALAQRMGSIDMGSALRKGGIMDLFTNEDEITGQNRSQLENLMLEIRSKGDIGATTKADRDEIARDIKEMQDNPDIIPVKMAQYGLDFNDLRELGVI